MTKRSSYTETRGIMALMPSVIQEAVYLLGLAPGYHSATDQQTNGPEPEEDIRLLI